MDILERDKNSVWHPFTMQGGNEIPVPLVRGDGACFFDAQGRKYIDGIASWWVNIHGHCNPYIAKKVSAQMSILEHAIFSGFTHEPAVQLAERLLKRLPPGHSKIFYSDNGSTAVEVGLKMAFQYWFNRDIPRTKVIAFENAYHGDTFGGMSVGARNAFNNPFEKLLFDVITIPVPVAGEEDRSINAMKAALSQHGIASFIFEPLVQGAGGMVMYPAAALNELIGLCRSSNVVTIADEVMTGFGRTGKFFATDHLTEKPDIICMSKGITGGFMPLGATSCAEFIYNAFRSEEKMKTFFHGHSYTANPTSCAAALASMDLFDQENVWKDIGRIAGEHQRFLLKHREHPAVKDARMLGTILAFEMRTSEKTSYLNSLAGKIQGFFIARGIILRPLGNVLYVLPPYCISDAELAVIYEAMEEFFDEVYNSAKA